MTAGEIIRMEAQIAVLKEIELEYPGQSIGNIIRQMKRRIKEAGY